MTERARPDASLTHFVDDRGSEKVHFDAILHPNRSLSQAGFYLVMAMVGLISLIMGTVFLIAGAWPVFGFYGLDVAIVYWAFRRNYHSARMYECVRLTDATLVVERVDTRGHHHNWTFQPHWMQIHMDDPPQHESQIRLVSHGRSLIIGSFLSPEERLDFANALRRALALVKNPLAELPSGHA
ncbi:DUF2244 domain-containing protein [Fodinicurvata sp. EGI_FJ10296]|uniref:DUF2244 domain-containing protein n=1 Tax=Fodinicurvata sp. EGI_FJ10296 TaxID=3231908 RepID=UPI00345722EE